MTTSAAPALRIHLSMSSTWTGSGPTIASAVALLARANRLTVVRDPADATVIHTVGADGWDLPTPGKPTVRTVDRVPLQPGRLRPTRGWMHTQRVLGARTAAWLAHGHTSARLLVEAGSLGGQLVRCLPVLHPPIELGADHLENGHAHGRAELRRALGIRPGVRVVVGAHLPGSAEVRGWRTAITELRRSDVLTVEVRPSGAHVPDSWVVDGDGDIPCRLLTLAEVLRLTDVYVAAGQELAATNMAVAAISAGIPVVATTTDSAAELIPASGAGLIVAPQARAIAEGVRSLVGRVPPPRRAVVDPVDRDRYRAQQRSLAGALLEIYDRAAARGDRRTR